MADPNVVFDEEFFLDLARWIAELSHSEVRTEIRSLSKETEWQVVYSFGLCFITLRFKVSAYHTYFEPELQSDYALLLEWEHFRVCPRYHGIGSKFAEIFLEELKLTPVKKVILRPKNLMVEGFWRGIGFTELKGFGMDYEAYLSLELEN